MLSKLGILRRTAVLANSFATAEIPETATVELKNLLRSLGYANLSVARLFEGHFNALFLIAKFGSEAQFARALRDAEQGHLFAIWNADAANAVRISKAQREMALTGAKRFCSGAGFVKRALITAATDEGGPLLVLAELDTHTKVDLSTWKPLGMRASMSGTVDFTGAPSARLTIIGQPGDYTREPFFSGGAWRFLSAQLGAINALADCVREDLHATGRHHDPLQNARFAKTLIAVETAELWVASASKKAEDNRLPSDLRIAYVGLARHAVEQASYLVMETLQRSLGLNALLQPHRAERIMRDLSTYLRQPAPDRVLANAASYAFEAGIAGVHLWSSPNAERQ